MPDDSNYNEATKLEPDDAPPGQRLDGFESYTNFYNRISRANDPEWDGPRRQENVTTERDHQHLVDSVASALSLTEYQKARAGKLVDSLDPRHFRANKNVAVVLAVCGIVGREDGRTYSPYSVNNDPDMLSASGGEFAEFARGNNISQNELARCWGRIEASL